MANAVDPYKSYASSKKTPVVADPFAMLADIFDPQPSPYMYDPVAWIYDHVNFGEEGGLTEYQEEILTALPKYHRVCVRGPHGLGKTTTASLAVLWFALTRDGLDWKIPTTASAWRQLEKFLWPEIHKWARKLRWDVLGRRPFNSRQELMALNLKLKTGQAFAAASDIPELIEGAHADRLFYLYDESKAISAETFNASEGAFSGAGRDTVAEAYALAISTPGEPNGRFWEIQTRKPGYEDWHVIHVSLDRVIKAGRISEEWAEQRERQWGRQSSIFQNRVLGEFASADEDAVIPLSWVEAAQERWKDRFDPDHRARKKITDELLLPAYTCTSCDPARSGIDKTTLAVRFGNVVREIRAYAQADSMSTVGIAAGVHRAQGGDGYIAVDVIGIGGPMVDKLVEDGINVFPFNAAGKTEQVDITGELGFVNQRSAAWWTMRELLDPINGFQIELPPDDLITGDLTAPHWRITSGSKIQVETKDDLKKRLGRSTDYGDAIVMAFALIPEPEEEVVYYDDFIRISPF
jgi:hypothetical protein